MTGRNDDQMQKKEEKELAAIKKRQRIMNERTEKIERENEKLKRLTKGLFEARKKQKNLNKKFAQLRQNDNVRVTIQAIVHSKAQQVRDSIEYSER
jgi:K+/H+ antiporter YhaU regulatory subunit KhtT